MNEFERVLDRASKHVNFVLCTENIEIRKLAIKLFTSDSKEQLELNDEPTIGDYIEWQKLDFPQKT